MLKNVVSISELKGCLNIPHSVWRTIRKNCENEELQRDECIYYWRNVSPFSMFGWSFLGGKLHYLGEESALRKAKEYIQTVPGRQFGKFFKAHHKLQLKLSTCVPTMLIIQIAKFK